MSRTYEQLEPVISALDERIKTNLGAFPTDTAEGSIASFADGADDIPLKSLVVDINPIQDLSQGDPSPENICPISGWTEVDVEQSGKNLFDFEGFLNRNNITYEKSGDSFTFFPSQSTYTNPWRFAKKDSVVSISVQSIANITSRGIKLRFLNDSGVTVFSTTDSVLSVRNIVASQVRLDWSTLGRVTITAPQIEFGTENTSYEPYNGQSITIPLGQTVYGGKLDVLSGVLTVYPYYASYNGETLTGRWISDRDVYAVGTTPTIGAQVVNIGAEGTEIQLSPTEVKSLLGQNNIFADTGDSSVEYRADTKMYIERLTEPDADMIADSNIVSGQYFMVGNSLYLATSNIASGGQVIVGTNCTQKSLATALNEINS